LSPNLFEVRAHLIEAFVVQAVEAPCSLGPVGDESGVFEKPEVPRHRWTAYRKSVGQLSDRSVPGAKHLEDHPPVRVAERIKRISGQRTVGH
jgi:hypothetical protein